MYIPPAFRDDDTASLHAVIKASRLANLITATDEGLVGTPLPLFLDDSEGEFGTLYGHVARANPQWSLQPTSDALAIFMGPDAYITPSWYQTKQETGKVVPTWNYVAVHAYGEIEFFDDTDRLREVDLDLGDVGPPGHRERARHEAIDPERVAAPRRALAAHHELDATHAARAARGGGDVEEHDRLVALLPGLGHGAGQHHGLADRSRDVRRELGVADLRLRLGLAQRLVDALDAAHPDPREPRRHPGQ